MKTIIASTTPYKLYTCISHRGIDWRIRASSFLKKMTMYPEDHWNHMRACAARACMFATGAK